MGPRAATSRPDLNPSEMPNEDKDDSVESRLVDPRPLVASHAAPYVRTAVIFSRVGLAGARETLF